MRVIHHTLFEFCVDIRKVKFSLSKGQLHIMDWDTPVTLFVCNIAPSLPDTFVRRILDQCGTVNRWKRAFGVKDEPCDFGFVDYASPNDALRALRVIPQIVILEKKWEAHIDKEKKFDLDSYESALKMRIDYDRSKETRKEQMIVHMVNEIVASSAFARTVKRLTANLESQFDEERTAEHYRYQNEVRHENDLYEQYFRNELIEWKKTEVQYNLEIENMNKSLVSSPERNEREDFLKKWNPPEFNIADPAAKQEYLNQWNKFLAIRRERKQIRENEKELERLL
ncbi:hypothetical protein TRFO_36786 [Tritrichomonas foetus]|uniref:RRM domain-containing protein n=1 Tax=Tritrichomonas foetus TaxID=1144522 RepID=A0A1J4JD46_9EUKA|nr:hypothetical protein TRFO_36786 [Tritrichomonas foetus]|eukprot:OHS97040.1 hypothetical protein TRFO_36786 [Tritrichomonas foetus]